MVRRLPVFVAPAGAASKLTNESGDQIPFRDMKE
jgi:hypothetical protein